MKKNFGNIRIALQVAAGILLVAGGLANLPITLLIILVTTVLAGPFFCGWICPFGTLQDLVSKLTKGIKKYRMPRAAQKVLVVARYLLMAITTLLTFDFIFTMLALDPRTNLLSILDGKVLTIAAYVILVLYLGSSIFFERPFCNYMCPQGAKYGIMSTLRPFRIVRDSEHCVDCGKCNKACPMNIDIMSHNNVKSLQCINCMSCVNACPKKGALKFGILKLNRKSGAAYFLAVAIILATSTVAMALQIASNQEAKSAAENQVIATVEAESSDSSLPSESTSAEVTTQAEMPAQTEVPIDTTTASSSNDMTNQSGTSSSQSQSSGANQSSTQVTSKSQSGNTASSNTSTSTTTATTSNTEAVTQQSTTNQSSSVQTTPVVATGAAAGIADGTYTGQGQGFKGLVTVQVTVKDQQITSVDVVDNNDDRKWFNRAYNSIPGWIIDAQSTDVDTVSGATYSSRGIISAVKDALNNAK